MRRLVTGRQMKEIDRYAMEEIGIPSMVLMERAALAACEALEAACLERLGRPLRETRVLALCGTGNNGGDGAAMARILFLRGVSVTVVTVGERARFSREMEAQTAIDERLGIPVKPFEEGLELDFDAAVDALFGVGLSRDVEGIFREAVKWLDRRKPALTLAVDIPSGVSSETGAVLGIAVPADVTVTFGFEKLGTMLYPGKGLAGRVTVADIGFPPCGDPAAQKRAGASAGSEGIKTQAFEPYFAYEDRDWERIPPRKGDSHKGTYGKVLIAAGSEGMCGAAYLSALAAYRMGAGLVKILTVKQNVPILQNLLPEAILASYDPERTEEEPEEFRQLVEEACAWSSVIVAGPGLGKGRHVAKLLQTILLSAYVPIILDADGLNAVAEYPHLAEYFTDNVIVTPHLGEMARLTGQEIRELRADLPGAARRYSEEKGVTCVLKDAVTVTARKDGMLVLNDSGCGAMAKAGSGDVLTGVIAGLIALGVDEEEAASLGVWIHGLAGTYAASRTGEHSLLARDIADALLKREPFV